MTPHRIGRILGSCLVVACGNSLSEEDSGPPPGVGVETAETGIHSDTGQLSTSGSIVFHRYSDYEAWDSILLMVELSDYSVTEISADWDIDHAMNAHFSPDGTQLVFMGDQRGGERDWDVFLWTIGSSDDPQNLTESWGTRDEDPKFTPAGTIVCKSNFDLIEMDTTGTVLGVLTSDGAALEQSMPFATSDGSQVIYALGAGENSDLHRMERDGTNDTVVQGAMGIQEYYPIVRDEETYLFTRWVSDTNVHDQVYLGHWDGKPAEALALHIAFACISVGPSQEADSSAAWSNIAAEPPKKIKI